MSMIIPPPRIKSDTSFIPRQGTRRSLTVLFDPAWKEMTDHQELLLMILEIREELITNVYEEYAKKAVEKQSVKFIVNCTLDAWKEIVNLNFLSHNFLNVNNETFWFPDSEPIICKPDSWSKTNLNINMKNYPKEAFQQTEDDAEYLFENVSYPTTDAFDLPLKDNFSVSEIHDVTRNSLISLQSDSLSSKLTALTTVRFSEADGEQVGHIIGQARASRNSENMFYKVMKMPRQSLPSLISTIRSPQKLKMLQWHLEDEIHDDLKKLCTIPSLRLTATTVLSNSYWDSIAACSHRSSTATASPLATSTPIATRHNASVQFSQLPDKQNK